MIEIQKAMNNEGFFPREIIADGKIHRFKKDSDDKGKSAWFIAYQNHTTKGGELFYVAIWSDWHNPDNVYKFCSLTTQSTLEKKIIEDQIRKAEQKRIEEQEKVWAETAEKAKKVFSELSETGTTPYLEKKKIDSLYGARIDDDLLAIPVCDIDGKLWGLQKIFPDGKKLFMAGTKKRGNFHVLRAEKSIEESEILYVCEGFATAASIRIATGQNVVCAFDAGNLHSVCEAIRLRYRDISLVLCGDDDRFTKLADGSLRNAGREKAEDAAKRFLGKAVFPDFGDCEEKLTDWDDARNKFGLDAVRSQILGVKTEKHYIRYLGHKGATYFYTSNSNKQIMALNGHGAEQLLDLQPLSYWEQSYVGKQGVDWKLAASDLKAACRVKGIFTMSNVRGLGVWRDEDRTVIHLGNRLWVNGLEIDLHEIKSRYIYSLEESQESLTTNPMTTENCSALVNGVRLMSWQRNQDHAYFLGWIVSSLIGGVLPWRPHLWLVGSTGAGKTTIYNLLKTLSHYPIHEFAGGTTEAGLRRSVRSSAISVIFDEFELNSEQTMSVNQSILAFMRQASSESGAKVVKADGPSGIVSYDPRFCGFVTGIRPSFSNEADRNRFTVIELDKNKHNKEQWATALEYLSKIDKKFASGLFMRTVSLLPVFLKNRQLIEHSLAARYYSRFAQQFSPILAGYSILLSDAAMTQEDADAMVDSFALQVEIESIKDTNDESEAIGQILKSKIRSREFGEISVQELIKMTNGFSDSKKIANDALMRHGLKYIQGKLFIASTHPELTKLFENTRFPINWNFTLGRLPGAEKDKTCNMFGTTTRGVLLPVTMKNDDPDQ